MSILTEKIKTAKEMKRTNRKLAILLAVASIILCVAGYFNAPATPIIVVSLSLSAFIGFISMMQTYQYQSWAWDHNPGTFWSVISAITAVALVVTAITSNLTSKHFLACLSVGSLPILVPIIGVLIGNSARIFRNESPVW